MTGDPSDLDPQQLWQSQKTEHQPMTIAEVHASARRFERRVRIGNLSEYIACAFVVLSFGQVALTGRPFAVAAGPAPFAGDPLIRLGAGLVVAATLFVAWQLRRRASLRAPLGIAENLVDAYRAALVRRRDALRSIGSWYLAPFVPGLVVMFAGLGLHKPPTAHLSAPAAHYVTHVGQFITFLVGILFILVFVVIWLLNQRGADLLQKRIDRL